MSRSDVTQLLVSPLRGVSAVLSASRHNFDRHWHESYCFGVLDRGGQSWHSRRGIVDAFAGAVINTTPGEVHDGRPIGGQMRYWRILSVDPATMFALTGRDNQFIEIDQPVISDCELARVLHRVFRIMERWTTGDKTDSTALAFEERLAEATTLFVFRHSTVRQDTTSPRADVRMVRDRLADDLTDAPSLDELAHLIGVSRFQLIRRFKACYGLPPHAWLLSCRAERARVLIRRGVSLARAATLSGFADQSHMTRIFKRFYGYSPGNWQTVFHRDSAT